MLAMSAMSAVSEIFGMRALLAVPLARLSSIALATSAGLILASVAPTAAQAHSRSQSFSTWRIADDGDVRLSFSVAAREVTRLVAVEQERLGLELEALMASHLARHLALRFAGRACPPVGEPRPLAAGTGHVRVEWRFQCPPFSDAPSHTHLEISVASFVDVAPSHVHFARVFAGEGPALEYLFTDAERTRAVDVGPSGEGPRPGAGGRAGATFTSYVALGIEHILAGLDHLAFLVALLLLGRSAREVGLLVTGFTLGHSVTLALAALGVLEPDIAVIEALIGFTIAIVAAEAIGVATGAAVPIGAVGAAALCALAGVSLWTGAGPPATVLAGLALFTICYLSLARTRRVAIRTSPVLTVIFGLVHGFGFASVLMEVGLPRDRLVAALLGFNVGVEIGQLAVVALVFGAGVLIARSLPKGGLRVAADTASAALCGLGLFWFVQRVY